MAALDGLTALVTGASASIGLASARMLAQDGATVVVMGRGEQSLDKARKAVLEDVPGASVETFVGDATDEESLKAALAFAYALRGRLDILIPTVGGAFMRPLLLCDAQSVRQEFEVNFMSNFLMVRHGAPLLSNGGTITCISTAAVKQTFPGMSIYSASKAALERFVRAAAFELAGAGIRVNAVRPGFTVAPETAGSPQHAAIVAETPLGRVGFPDDIASVVRFLAGPESGWVTGQTFSADGGLDQGKAPDMMDMLFGKETMDQVRAGKVPELTGEEMLVASSALRPTAG